MTDEADVASRKYIGHTRPIGFLVTPSGQRVAVLALLDENRLLLQGTYVTFESALRSAFLSRYTLDTALSSMELRDAWEKVVSAFHPV